MARSSQASGHSPKRSARELHNSVDTTSAIILCDSAALGEAVARALQPLPTKLLRIDRQSELPNSDVDPTLILVIEVRGDAAVQAIRAAKNQWPGSPTLVVGISNEEDMILACVAAGADGVVDSREGLPELRTAVESVVAGNLRVPGSIMRRLVNRLVQIDRAVGASSSRARSVRLSVREREILRWIATDLSNKEIADRLGIAEQTVKNHVGRVLQKLGVHSRFDAARLAKLPDS